MLRIALALALLATAAHAQSPCARTGAPVDEMRCELAIVRASRAELQERFDKTLTAAQLMSADNVKREKELAEWFSRYFGTPVPGS